VRTGGEDGGRGAPYRSGMASREVYRHSYGWTLLKVAAFWPFAALLWTILAVFAIVVVGFWIDRRVPLLFMDLDTAPWSLGGVAALVGGFLLVSALRSMLTERVTLDYGARVVRFEGIPWWSLGEGSSGPWFGFTGFRWSRRRMLELPMAAVLGAEEYWGGPMHLRRRTHLRVLGPNVVVDVPWQLWGMKRLSDRLRSIAASTPAPPARATRANRERMIVSGAKLAWVIGLAVVAALLAPWLMS